MSKKKNKTQKNEEPRIDSPEPLDETSLTPWQKENLEYLKSQGDHPVWDTVKEETEAIVEETPENQASEITSQEEDVESEPVDSENSKKKTYESFADRLPNIKKIRNKRLYRRLTLIISIFVVAIVIALYFVSPLSKLGAITVTGNQSVDSQKIIQQSKLVEGDSLWGQFNDRKIYEEKIERQLPRIKKASISLNGINSFKIAVEEYKIIALESSNGEYHPILENGKILSEKSSTPESGLPIFANFKDQTIIKNLMNSYNQLPENIKQNISEIRYSPSNVNKELVNLQMKDTNVVIVNISQMVEKMAYYDKVASQMDKHGTVDMEVGIFSYPFETGASNESGNESSQAPEEN